MADDETIERLILSCAHPRLTLDIGWSDLFSLFSSGRDIPAEISSAEIQHSFGGRQALPALSVRSAFAALLCALRAAPGSEVVMSAINITHMADLVRAQALVPVVIDLDPSNLAPPASLLREAITSRTVLYLHAHLFGTRNDLAPLARVCRDRSVLVIRWHVVAGITGCGSFPF